MKPLHDTTPAAGTHPRDFRIYERVQLNALVYANRHVAYRVSFRLPYTVRVSWPTSKRLIEGTLVLLSKDNFEKDLKIATVVQRGDEPMKGANRFEFMVDICLERDNPLDPLGFGDPSSMDQDTYVMIEATDGYFEAYRHILNVLKNVKEDELPFKSYLVDVDKDVRVPYYAANKRYYDLDTSPKPNKRMPNRKPIDIMGTWPPYNIGMDKTQLDALQTILSNDLAIIQGPPGTGKTYVGTYGMKVLLANLESHIGPVVCICQTNHALDQFLEHIFDFEDRIVRIGGRSKSNILKDNVIYELRKMEPKAPGMGAGRLYRQRDEIGKKIDQALMEMYEDPCVTLAFLAKYKLLRPRQLDALRRLGEREDQRRKQQATSLDTMDDDAWVVSAVQPPPQQQLPPALGGRHHRKKQEQASKEWSGNNPNHAPAPAEEKPLNAIEVWLQDAIEMVGRQDTVSMYADEMKDLLLEQQKGLVFEDDLDESELLDEDEAIELKQNFFMDATHQDLRGNKSRFINIGNAYKATASSSPASATSGVGFFGLNSLMGQQQQLQQPNERKVINYKKPNPLKIKTKVTKKSNNNNNNNSNKAGGGFDFFSDEKPPSPTNSSLLDDLEYEQEDDDDDGQHEVLERWMKDDDVTMWPLTVRLKAHKQWADLRNRHLQQHVQAMVDQYNRLSMEIRRVNVRNDAKLCRGNRVIGMTSTAAAKYHDLLEEIQPSVIVVEEAAEMLESHIVTALTSSLQHLILIGDHQQLRPSTAVHRLSEHHHLNVSLFERLINNDFPYTRLSHQRRMRPDIRTLINPIYSDPPLQDHADVMHYPPVAGMQRNVFFLAHEEPEDHLADTASKCNLHEAEMVARLSCYLLQQHDLSPKDITIITMYAGQRAMIKRQLRNVVTPECDPTGIHVSSVDGYQGEENKIILLSLVRSNTNGQIGFLKVANRVCVALSRAKHGMYIVGNARLLCDKSDLWNEIVMNMEEDQHHQDMIGTTLGLKCASHNVVTQVQWPVDFTEVKEGGCSRACGTVLDCGHQCPLRCHSYEHDDVRCMEPCRKMFTECGHRCTRSCSSDCGSCITQVRLQLPCGHHVQGDCGKLRRELKAQGGKCRACM
ncbi:unnamed protein product [Absidia cylindrospora]